MKNRPTFSYRDGDLDKLKEPIIKLIDIGKEQIPKHLKANQVVNGRLLEPTEEGPVEMQIVALPPENKVGTLGRFWNRIKGQQPEQLPPTPLNILPKTYFDEFQQGYHVQLMATNPYVVLEDGTHYGIVITVPSGLQGQWENFEEPSGDLFSNEIKIGQKKIGLAVVVRTDGR